MASGLNKFDSFTTVLNSDLKPCITIPPFHGLNTLSHLKSIYEASLTEYTSPNEILAEMAETEFACTPKLTDQSLDLQTN